jgi:hypothetical protein
MTEPVARGPSETARVDVHRFLPFPTAVFAFINAWASLAMHGLLVAFFILPVRKSTSRRPAM